MTPSLTSPDQNKATRSLPHGGASAWLPAISLLAGLAFLIQPLCAQSAANFNTAPLTPKVNTSNKDNQSPTSGKETAPVNATPSRYVSEADLDAYVQSISSIFSIKKRVTDPFGQMQDPDAKPVFKPTLAKTTRRVTQIQATPFSEIIRMIRVTTVMPLEKCFLIGTRSIKEGQRFIINFHAKNINIEVVSVTSQAIELRNLESGESSALMLNLLPAGMTPGTKGITAPGMVPDLPNAVIELDAGGSPNEISHK